MPTSNRKAALRPDKPLPARDNDSRSLAAGAAAACGSGELPEETSEKSCRGAWRPDCADLALLCSFPPGLQPPNNLVSGTGGGSRPSVRRCIGATAEAGASVRDCGHPAFRSETQLASPGFCTTDVQTGASVDVIHLQSEDVFSQPTFRHRGSSAVRPIIAVQTRGIPAPKQPFVRRDWRTLVGRWKRQGVVVSSPSSCELRTQMTDIGCAPSYGRYQTAGATLIARA